MEIFSISLKTVVQKPSGRQDRLKIQAVKTGGEVVTYTQRKSTDVKAVNFIEYKE